jgi:VanZ family protein
MSQGGKACNERDESNASRSDGEPVAITRLMRYWGPVAVYTGLIFYLSGQSHPEEDLPSFVTEFSDKLLHAVEYAGLGALCYRAFRWGTTGSWAQQAALLALLAASFYGVTDEVHQSFVPFRESSWQDWVADTMGAGAGVAAMSGLRGLLPARISRRSLCRPDERTEG